MDDNIAKAVGQPFGDELSALLVSFLLLLRAERL